MHYKWWLSKVVTKTGFCMEMYEWTERFEEPNQTVAKQKTLPIFYQSFWSSFFSWNIVYCTALQTQISYFRVHFQYYTFINPIIFLISGNTSYLSILLPLSSVPSTYLNAVNSVIFLSVDYFMKFTSWYYFSFMFLRLFL